MDVSDIEAMVTLAVRKAMAAETRRAGQRRHVHRRRWSERVTCSHWAGRGGQGA